MLSHAGTYTFDNRCLFLQLRFYMHFSRSPLVVAGAAAIVAALACVLWWSSACEAESGKQVTTQEAAAAVGAKVFPSDPKLQSNFVETGQIVSATTRNESVRLIPFLAIVVGGGLLIGPPTFRAPGTPGLPNPHSRRPTGCLHRHGHFFTS